DLLLDRVQRIERGHRLLEDDADVVAAHVPDLPLAHGEQILALEADHAGGMMRRRIWQGLHDRQRRCRPAGGPLAHQPPRLAFRDVEGDGVDRERLARALAKGDRKVLHLEQLGGHWIARHRKVLRGSKASRTASPMKIRSDSMTATVKKPEMPSQ